MISALGIIRSFLGHHIFVQFSLQTISFQLLAVPKPFLRSEKAAANKKATATIGILIRKSMAARLLPPTLGPMSLMKPNIIGDGKNPNTL